MGWLDDKRKKYNERGSRSGNSSKKDNSKESGSSSWLEKKRAGYMQERGGGDTLVDDPFRMFSESMSSLQEQMNPTPKAPYARDFYERQKEREAKEYKSGDEAMQRRLQTGGQVSDILRQAAEARASIEERRELYDSTYGAGAVDSLLSSVANSESYLQNILAGADSEARYWNQFENEDDYNEQLAAQAEYERLSSYDLPGAKRDIDSLHTQLDKVNAALEDAQRLSESASPENYKALMDNVMKIQKQRDDIENQIAGKEHEYKGADTFQRTNDYMSLVDSPDFMQYAQTGAQMPSTLKNKLGSINYHDFAYQYMTSKEKAVYSYLLGKEGMESADAFLDTVSDQLRQRQGSNEADSIKDSVPLQLIYGAGAGANRFEKGIEQLFSSEALPTNALQYADAAVREDLGKDGARLPDWLGGATIGQAAHDVLNSVGYMAPSIAVSAATGGAGAPAAIASAAGAATMGLGTKGSTYKEALDQGYSKRQAENYSWLVGASEGGLQYVLGGVSSLGGKLTGNFAKSAVSNIKNAALRFAVSAPIKMFGEGTEEYLQEVLDPAFRNLALGENNKVELLTKDGAYAFMLGAITAGVLDGPTSMSNDITAGQFGRGVVESGHYDVLLDNALKSPNAEVRALAERLQSGKLQPHDINVGELAKAYAESGGDLSILQQPVSDIESKTPDGYEVTEQTDDRQVNAVAKSIGEANDSLMRAAQELATGKPQEATEATPQNQSPQTTEYSTIAPAKSQTSVATLSGEKTSARVASYDESGVKLVVTGISSVENGNVYVSKDNGQTAALDDITMEDVNADKLYSYAAEFDTNGAKAFVSSYDGSVPVVDYFKGFKAIYGAARVGIDMKQAVSLSLYGKMLPQAVQQAAYFVGQNAISEPAPKAEDQTIEPAAEETKAEPKTEPKAEEEPKQEKGGVVRAYKGKTTKEQEAQIDAIDKVFKAIGRTVVFEDTIDVENKKGEVVKSAANAYFDPKKNEYHIALDSIGQAYAYFALHESIHDIRANNELGYENLEQAVFDTLKAKGEDIDALIDAQRALYPNESEAYWHEEIVANTVPVILTDKQTGNEFAQRIAGENEQTRSVFIKLLNKIKTFLKKAYNILKEENSWRQMESIKGDMDVIAAIRGAYFAALDEIASSEGGTDGDVRLSAARLNPDFVSQVDIDANIQKIIDMKPVTELAGDEFPRASSAKELVAIVYDRLKNTRSFVNNPILGDIAITKKGIASDVSHGYGHEKIVSFVAIPDVIKNGHIIDIQYNWKGNQEDRVIIAAPIVISETEYYAGVVVTKTMGADKYYLHEVAAIKNDGTESPYKTGAAPKSELAGKDSAPSIINILQKLVNYNGKFSMKDVELKAKEVFGTTSNWKEAGYITTDGTVLDFSGKRDGARGGYRAQDHREISRAFEKDIDGTDALVEFMAGGNIRLEPESPGIDISVKPSADQRPILRRYIDRFWGEVMVDFSNINGNLDGSVQFPRGTSSSAVIAGIDKYFDTGEMPKVSDTNRFRFSLKDRVDPMYSRMQNVLDEYKGDKIAANGLIPYLSSRGVKAEEIKWSGVEQYIAGKKSVTKGEMAEFLAGNSLQIKDVAKGKNQTVFEYSPEQKARLDELSERDNALMFEAMDIYKAQTGKEIAAENMIGMGSLHQLLNRYTQVIWLAGDSKAAERYEDIVQEARQNHNEVNRIVSQRQGEVQQDTKYEQYKLAGGENYRELLFTLPSETSKDVARRKELAALDEFRSLTDLEQSEYDLLRNKTKGADFFQSSHWNEQNVLAHTRLQDFTAADGGRVLFVDEVQSDWHQEGREKGYTKPVTLSLGEYKMQDNGYEIAEVYDQDENMVAWILTKSDSEAKWTYYADASNGSRIGVYHTQQDALDAIQTHEAYRFGEVPDAPFRDTWHEYVMKRVLRMAAEGDYNYVAWTTGQMQADRYNLSKHVDRIDYNSGSQLLQAFNGNRLVFNENTPPENLHTYLGKEIAQKLIDNKKWDNAMGGSTYVLEGESLTFGGEGMKGFYDIGGRSSQNIPRFMDKYVKQWGSKIEEIAMGDDYRSEDAFKRDGMRGIVDDMKARPQPGDYIVPGVRVTESMKEDVLYRGQPLFSLKDTEEVNVRKLERENKRLTEALEIIKGQFKLTEGHKVSDKAITRLARKILKDTNSAYDAKTLIENLSIIYDYLANTEQPAWDEVSDMGVGMAMAILEKSSTLDTDTYTFYADAREYLRNTKITLNETQRQEAANGYDSYRNYRQALFGRVNIGNDGILLDVAWQELSQKYPELFDPDLSDADMPQALMDAADAIRPQYTNPHGYNMREAAYDLFLQIHEAYFEMPEVKTFADKQASKLMLETSRLRNKIADIRQESKVRYNERIKKLRADNLAKRKNLVNKYNEAKVKQHKADMDRFKKQYEALRDKKNEQLIRQRASFREWKVQDRAKRAEQSARDKYRRKIEQNVNDMYTWLVNPTDTKHVPESMRNAVTEFIDTIDFVGVKETSKTIRWNERMRDLKDMMARIGRADLESNDFYADVDPDFVPMLEDFITENRKTDAIGNMNAEQLKELDLIVSIVKKAITQANWLHTNARYKTVSDIGGATMSELGKLKTAKVYNGVMQLTKNLLSIGQLDAFSYFDQLGEAAKSVLASLRKGLDAKTRHIDTAVKYMERAVKGADIKKWSGTGAEVRSFQVVGGELKLTVAQIMELYLLNQREQARGHIYIGGIKPADQAVRKGWSKQHLRSFEPVKVNEKDVNNIIGTLNHEQRAVADAMQRFVNEDAAEWGNETSMILYGYKKFTEEEYWPIKTDENFVNAKDPQANTGLWALKNLGMTKATIKGASNPLMVGDVFDTFTQHVDQMATYNGFVVPLSDAMKWFNFKINDIGSVKQSIERVVGKQGKMYFINLVKDINGMPNTPYSTGISDKLIRNAKLASVGFNTSVVIQQPFSYIRAAAEISPKHLTAALFKKSNIAKARQYAPIVLWKSWGFYDLNIGKSLRQIIVGDSTVLQGIGNVSLAPAQFADNITWGTLWNACELETKKKRPDLKVGSEEFNMAVGERLSNIIDRTQVVDTVFHRSQLMRSENSLVKLYTAFMAEPTKTYNMLRNALVGVARNEDGSKTRLVRIATVFIATQIANAAVRAIIQAFRDDDDETWAEKWLKSFGSESANNLNPLSMIPGARDVMSIIEGYDVSRLDLKGVETFINTANAWIKYANGESQWSIYKLIYQSSMALSSITGVPVGNIVRAFNSIYNAVSDKKIDMQSETATATKSYKTIYEAILAGDDAKVESIRKALLSDKDSPKSETDIAVGIAKVLMENDERVVKAYEARSALNTSKLRGIRSDIMADGFSSEIVDKAINLYENTQNGSAKAEGKELSAPLYDYSDLDAAIVSGNESAMEDIYKELLLDSDAADPVKAIKNHVASEFRDDYLEAVESGDTITANDLAAAMLLFGYTDENLGDWVMDDKTSKLKESIRTGDIASANQYIYDEMEIGRTDAVIKNSITSTFKAEVQKLYAEGNMAAIEDVVIYLGQLELYESKGGPYYTSNWIWSWME